MSSSTSSTGSSTNITTSIAVIDTGIGNKCQPPHQSSRKLAGITSSTTAAAVRLA